MLHPTMFDDVGPTMLACFKLTLKACSNEAHMLVQHHPTLFDAKCWPRLNTMLDDVG